MVLIQMPRKSGLRLSPSKTLRWPWILRALTSLKRVIITKVLKMMVKCWEASEREPVAIPVSMSNRSAPDKHISQRAVFLCAKQCYSAKQERLHRNCRFVRLNYVFPYCIKYIINSEIINSSVILVYYDLRQILILVQY